MKRIFFLGCFLISSAVFAQNCGELYEQVQTDYNNGSLSSEQLEKILRTCGDIDKYPKLYYYRGLFALNNENYALGVFELQRVYKYVDDFESQHTVLVNLGVLYVLQKDYEQSRKHFQMSYDLAIKNKSESHADYSYESLLAIELESGNISYLDTYEDYFIKKDFKKDNCAHLHTLAFLTDFAITYKDFNRAERLIKSHFKDSAAYKDCALDLVTLRGIQAKIALQNKEFESALLFLNSIPFKRIALIDRVPTYKIYQEVFEKLDNEKAVAIYADSTVTVLEQNKIANNKVNANALEGVETVINKDKNKISNLWLFLYFVSALLVIAAVIIYVVKKAKSTLQVKKNFYQENYNNLWGSYQLTNKKLQILKQELITQKGQNNAQMQSLIKDINLHLDTNAADVHNHLNMVDNKFIVNLRNEAPYLSDKELQVCFFFKLQLSHKKIAEILSKSEKSIDSYRYRINKKVQENQQTDLKTILQHIDY